MVTHRARDLIRLGIVTMLAASIVSCDFEDPVAPGRKVVIVHAVLDLGALSQAVLVQYSDGAGRDVTISGAQVTITTPEGIQMSGTPDTVTRGHYVNGYLTPFLDTVGYRISPSAYGVTLVPGGTYSLHVHTLAGEDVTGTTTVPLASPVTIDAIETVFIQRSDTLTLPWTAISGAASYEIRTSMPTTKSGSSCAQTGDYTYTCFNPYSAFTSHPISLPGTLQNDEGNDVFLRGLHISVMVCAVDANYYEYYRVLSDPFRGAAPSHLVGGMGVFGSLVPIAGRRLDVR
jgi:hypothetical protein